MANNGGWEPVPQEDGWEPVPTKEKTSIGDVLSGNRDSLSSYMGMSRDSFENQIKQNRESLLPTVGQIMGSPYGMPGSVAGATAGQAINQGIKAIPGQQFLPNNAPNPNAIRNEALLTAATEGLFRAPAAIFFRKARANKEVQEGVGKVLSEQKNTLADLGDTNPNFTVPSAKVSNFFKQFEKLSVPFGEPATIIKRWKKVIDNSDVLSARQLMELETDLGSVIKWSKDVGGEMVQQKVKKPAVQTIATQARKLVSDEVEALAKKAGLKDFAKNSALTSKFLKRASAPNNFLRRTVESGLLGNAIGMATGNPGLGIGVMGAGVAMTDDTIKNLFYRWLERSGVGRGVTVGTTGVARELLAQQ